MIRSIARKRLALMNDPNACGPRLSTKFAWKMALQERCSQCGTAGRAASVALRGQRWRSGVLLELVCVVRRCRCRSQKVYRPRSRGVHASRSRDASGRLLGGYPNRPLSQAWHRAGADAPSAPVRVAAAPAHSARSGPLGAWPPYLPIHWKYDNANLFKMSASRQSKLTLPPPILCFRRDGQHFSHKALDPTLGPSAQRLVAPALRGADRGHLSHFSCNPFLFGTVHNCFVYPVIIGEYSQRDRLPECRSSLSQEEEGLEV
jgi:hypothetical protein